MQPVDVNKLVKGRPLDNMEFMQWFKAYWDTRLGSQHLNYDPVGRRTHAKSGAMKGAGSRPAAGSAAARRPTDSEVRYRQSATYLLLDSDSDKRKSASVAEEHTPHSRLSHVGSFKVSKKELLMR